MIKRLSLPNLRSFLCILLIKKPYLKEIRPNCTQFINAGTPNLSNTSLQLLIAMMLPIRTTISASKHVNKMLLKKNALAQTTQKLLNVSSHQTQLLKLAQKIAHKPNVPRLAPKTQLKNSVSSPVPKRSTKKNVIAK